MSAYKKALFYFIGVAMVLILIEAAARTVHYQRNSHYSVALYHIFDKYVMGNTYGNALPSVKRHRFGFAPWYSILDLPEDIRRELTDLNAVVGNAGNPTGSKRHDTILVEPDERMRYLLRPDITVRGYVLDTSKPFNVDPPVLYIEDEVEMPPRAQWYVDSHSRHSFSYTIDEERRRITLPAVEAERAIAVVGDSVGFGIGVDDEHTVASKLQALVGDGIRVINGSVGGYGAEQSLTVARDLAKAHQLDTIVYVACENDFWIANHRRVMADTFEGLADLSRETGAKVVVVLETYLEYNSDDLLGIWPLSKLRHTDDVRGAARELAGENGLEFFDWTDVVRATVRNEKSVFAPMALYVDHVHLSPKGNALLAEEIRKRL